MADLPAFLTARQRERAEQIRVCLHQGMKRKEACKALGISNGGLNTILLKLTSSACWPRALPDGLFDVPVKSMGHVHRVEKARGPLAEEEKSMPGVEIEARRNAVLAERAERENYWLEQERQRYGLRQRGRPLSGMPA